MAKSEKKTDQKYAILGLQECYDIFNANEKLDLGVDTTGKTEEQVEAEIAKFSKKEIISKLKSVAAEKGADIGAIRWEKLKNEFGTYWSVLFCEYVSTPIGDDESLCDAFDGVDIDPYLKITDGEGYPSVYARRTPRGSIINFD